VEGTKSLEKYKKGSKLDYNSLLGNMVQQAPSLLCLHNVRETNIIDV